VGDGNCDDHPDSRIGLYVPVPERAASWRLM
jgi:hypothetical protein